MSAQSHYVQLYIDILFETKDNNRINSGFTSFPLSWIVVSYCHSTFLPVGDGVFGSRYP